VPEWQALSMLSNIQPSIRVPNAGAKAAVEHIRG